MSLNLGAFLLARKIADQEGLDDREKNKLGALAGFMGMTPSSLMLTKEMAQRETAPAAATQPVPPPVSPELEYLKELDRKMDTLLERIEKLMPKQSSTDGENVKNDTTKAKTSSPAKSAKK